VFGEGAPDAEVVFVGEQPGDQEDRQGAPFVGPAGRLLHRALAEVGLDHERIYLTNAVKHFKWTPRGKRRIHEKPSIEEMLACHLWLELELATIRPRVIVGLGATAARALLGPTVRVMRDRGKPLESTLAPVVIVTVHPSSLLRAPDAESRRAAWHAFVQDLRVVREAVARPARTKSTRTPRETSNGRPRSKANLE
jgi:uracil-DNA glycosylase family protein